MDLELGISKNIYEKDTKRIEMKYSDFVEIVVKECIDYADYMDFISVDEFDEDDIMNALLSSHNEGTKEALKFYNCLSVQKANILMERVFKKLDQYVEELYQEVDSDIKKMNVCLGSDSMKCCSKDYDDFLYSGYGSSMSFEQYQRDIVGLPPTRFATNDDFDNWSGSGLGTSMSFNEYCRRNGLIGGSRF